MPLTTIAIFATALLLGAMAFFSFVVAPVVFARLDRATAGTVIRALFPAYYLVVIILGAAAALPLALAGQRVEAAVMALVAAAGVLLRQGLLPALDAVRPAKESGDAKAARRFAALHRVSVIVNLLQLAATAVALARLTF